MKATIDEIFRSGAFEQFHVRKSSDTFSTLQLAPTSHSLLSRMLNSV